MKPAQYSRTPERYEPMRALVNQALAFAGLVVDQTGAISVVEAAQTLPEAQRRARELRADLEGRGVHADVLKFCRAELLADDYFHAVQEAVKSVADKMRSRTGPIRRASWRERGCKYVEILVVAVYLQKQKHKKKKKETD